MHLHLNVIPRSKNKHIDLQQGYTFIANTPFAPCRTHFSAIRVQMHRKPLRAGQDANGMPIYELNAKVGRHWEISSKILFYLEV